MNTPEQQPSHTEAYTRLLAQNVASGMKRDMADIEARRALGLKMTERDKANLAKNNGEPERRVSFDDTYAAARQLGNEVMAADGEKGALSAPYAEARELEKQILKAEGGQFYDTYEEAHALGRDVQAAEDKRKMALQTRGRVDSAIESGDDAKAIEIANSIPRGYALNAELISDLLIKTFGTDVRLSDIELELLARDYAKNEGAIKASRNWPELKDALLRTEDANKKAIPDLEAKADELIDALRAA